MNKCDTCHFYAFDDEEYVPEKAVSGLQGWVDCFEKAEFAGSLFCGGISDPGEADEKDTEKDEAYQFGRALELGKKNRRHHICISDAGVCDCVRTY